jgi:hypothetical protein
MTDNHPNELIAERLAEIARERSSYKQRMGALDAEEAELRVAQRVNQRFARNDGAHTGNGAASPIPKKGPPRPRNIPTTRAMINTLLTEAAEAGKPGLTGKELVLGIAGRWWPGAGWNDVLPDAARLVRSDKLLRSGGVYKRAPSANSMFPTDQEEAH